MNLIPYIYWSLILSGSKLCEGIPSVELPQGRVEGTHKMSYRERIFSAFEGIPYAKPPIGDLRFKEPIPAGKWNGILVANKSFICSQTVNGKFSGSEDCLYVNIYVPDETINSSSLRDVIIHIHGGGFYKGSPGAEALPDYLMDKDVIVATFTYRLAVLGFLSTNDGTVPGNNGLKDQTLAMKWVKQNIKYFGGNPNSITLTGFSVGGVSVHYHYLSPLSTDLFNRGYSISGTALNPRSLEKEPLEKARKLAASLKCPVDASEEMVDCFSKLTVQELTNTQLEFRPTIERQNSNPFLPDHPYKLIIDKKIVDVPWVVTNVADEAFFLIDSIYKEKSALEVYRNWNVEGLQLLQLNATVEAADLGATLTKLKEKYFGANVDNEDDAIDKLNRIMSDRHFFVGSDLLLRTQAAAMKSPLYYGFYSFVPEDYLQCGGKRTAASHCVDERLMFKFENDPKELQPKEGEMMFLLTQFLETYAKTGIPKLGKDNWIPINSLEDPFNVLSIESPESIKMTKRNQLVDRSFWNTLPIKENNKLYPK